MSEVGNLERRLFELHGACAALEREICHYRGMVRSIGAEAGEVQDSITAHLAFHRSQELNPRQD